MTSTVDESYDNIKNSLHLLLAAFTALDELDDDLHWYWRKLGTDIEQWTDQAASDLFERNLDELLSVAALHEKIFARACRHMEKLNSQFEDLTTESL